MHYSLVLPEGSLRPRFRTDITNEEAKVDFVGGYTEPMETINYVGCNILDNKDGVLNEVRFFYNQPIMLSPNAKIQLFGNNNKLIKEATPVLTKEKEQWVVSCNFGGVEVPHEGCYIVIPAGSIISANGNVVVSRPLKTIFQHKVCTDKLYADSFYKVQKNSHSSFEVICCCS